MVVGEGEGERVKRNYVITCLLICTAIYPVQIIVAQNMSLSHVSTYDTFSLQLHFVSLKK